MKNKMRMIKAAIRVRCVSWFVGPPPTFLASPATLNLFDNPDDIAKSIKSIELKHFQNLV